MNDPRRSPAIRTALTVPALLLVILVAALPVRASAQQPTCDGNFHIVHRLDIGEGAISDIDFSTPVDGWVVGQRNLDRHRSRPFVARFDTLSVERIAIPRFARRTRVTSIDALSPNDAWVVGTQLQRGTLPYDDAFAMHWDGSTWTRVQIPTPGRSSYLTAIKAIAPNDVWAVGTWERRGDDFEARTLVLHFDGVSWSRVSAPSPHLHVNVLFAIDGSSPTDVWASGYRGRGHALVLRWNGSEWQRVQLDRSIGDGIGYGLSAPAPGDVWVVGGDPLSSAATPFAVHWDGTQWQSPPVPDLGGEEIFVDVFAEQGEAWAVGARFLGDRFFVRAARWDGSAWSHVSVEGTGVEFMDGVTGDGLGNIWGVAFGVGTAGNPYSAIERACS